MTLRYTTDFVSFLQPRFDRLPVEQVWIVCMDVLARVVGVHQISSGSPISSEINVRRIMQLALADNASSLIIAHNHPSGIALPSEPDILATIELAKALKGVGIRLRDHLIFARDNECVSFNDSEAVQQTLEGLPFEL